MKKTLQNLVLISGVLLPTLAFSAGGSAHLDEQEWEFNDITKPWDKVAIMRGYEVATQVCLSCHSFKYINHRNMMDVGFSEEEVKMLASKLDMTIDQHFQSPLTDADAKEVYAKPLPELSLMVRARPQGADYVYSVLTGYIENPEEHPEMCKSVPDSAYCNKAFPGHAIAMPPPLMNGLIEYFDGEESSIEQMAKDVVYFMAWASEPEKKDRESIGVFVLFYLIIMSVLLYFTKKKIWKKIKH